MLNIFGRGDAPGKGVAADHVHEALSEGVDDTMDTYVIADRVAAVVELVPEPTDLPSITNLNEWGRTS